MRQVVLAMIARLFASRLAARLPERMTLRLVDRAVSVAMTRDTLADLPDGIHVMLCGAGSPLADIKRSGPCVAIQAGEQLYVFDAGTNGARNLSRFGVNVGRVEAVFLTHAHSDHIDGLGELGILRWVNAGASSPLPVHGPPVVDEVTDGFNRAYAADMRYRVEHHGPDFTPAAGGGLDPVSFPLPAEGELRTVLESEHGVRISVFLVSHEPVSEAVGYRIDYRGRSVVISGDTTKSANLIQHARGVDLLVHEALDVRLTEQIAAAAEAAGNARAAQGARDIISYHTTPVEAAESAAEAGAGQLLLYHIAPLLLLPALERQFLRGTRDAFSGKITLGTDGTLISLPTRP